VRLGALEIDVVARKDELIALVEVRTRKPGAMVGALASIGPKKRARLVAAAARVLVTPPFPLDGVERVRLDVCVVHLSKGDVTIEHFPAAITAQEES
jgi:putative endonuclease